MKTVSEEAVESYFSSLGGVAEKIAEGTEKSPDYRVLIDDLEIFVEVKQFDANPDELRKLRELEEGEVLLLDVTPGQGVRRKISDAAGQLRDFAKGTAPALVVLFNNRPFMLGDPASEYEVRVGMYGFDTIFLSKGEHGEAPVVVDRRFGGSRKLTQDQNTTISGIATMRTRGEEFEFKLYHNEHAAMPLPHGFFSRFGAQEFVLMCRERGRFQEWAPVDGS